LTEQKPSAGQHLLDGTIRVSLAEALIFPTGLVTAAFLTRWLGPSDYGLLTLAVTLASWIQWSIASMLNRATSIYISQSTDWRGVGMTALRLFLVTGLLAGIMLWLLAEPIASLLGEPRLAGLLQILSIDIPLFSLVQAHRSILIGRGRYRQRAWTSVGRWLTRMLLVIALVWAGYSVEGAILGMIGATLLELLISRYFVKP
jgi:O-antigen/teichoic acid export membrane protein